MGWLVDNRCTTIYGCVQPALMPDGTDSCTACNSTEYYVVPVNGKCKCLNGTLVNGQCFDNPGCITVVIINGIQRCAACNILAKLILNSNYKCVCQHKYALKEGVCQDKCADGFVVDQTNRFTCDDGNTDDNDGCDSQCLVESGYRC